MLFSYLLLPFRTMGGTRAPEVKIVRTPRKISVGGTAAAANSIDGHGRNKNICIQKVKKSRIKNMFKWF